MDSISSAPHRYQAAGQSAPPDTFELIPPVGVIHSRLGRALREVALLRRLLSLAEKAEEFRCINQGMTFEDSHA